ncbi:type II toxin-antitoxin system RelE/ParE family toxin [Hafnia alvei]|uniref:type II toxin-antitoxin system RelE/ParE family toxin n=1 Tax=Hafnia alvei TaxID=569 RepID=UPI001F262203|nr:type II toxin-antitoxin system RelE/ParE family toxin [Hafnia alvei]MCE9872706.1 type II toxin-antitoxin system RelE/ParE family toxin [Hafnia alvei]
MSKQPLSIEYTETAKSTLNDIVYYLQYNQIDPRPIVGEMLDDFENKVGIFPQGCPIAPELVKIGCDKYRECNTANGYRILYSATEERITVHVILSQRQDIQQLLFKRLIEA